MNRLAQMFVGGSSRLDAILAGFSKTIEQLETLVSDNQERFYANEDTIVQLEDVNEAIANENDKALRVVSKLRDLLS